MQHFYIKKKFKGFHPSRKGYSSNLFRDYGNNTSNDEG
jgi:hypothetical protein